MSFKSNWGLIMDAIHDRRAIRTVANKLNKENKVDRDKERIVNSVTSEMMNFFSMVKAHAEESRIELNGMRVEPNQVNKRDEETFRDPKVIIEVMKETPLFNQDFDVKATRGPRGEQQYIITEKQFNPDEFR